MSMNLHCEEMDLWQTPSYITYLCMNTWELKDNPDNPEKSIYKYHKKVKEDIWYRIRERYALWIQYQINGTDRHMGEEHLKDLFSYKKLHFYVM